MLTNQQIESLISCGESETVEYKESCVLASDGQKAEFVKDLLALVNAHGDEPRYLVIGVANSGELKGVGANAYDENVYRQIADSAIMPPVPYSFQRYKVQGNEIIVLAVEPSAKRFHLAKKQMAASGNVVLHKGEILIRRGTSKGALTEWDMERFRQSILDSGPNPELLIEFSDKQQSTNVTLAYSWANLGGEKTPLIASIGPQVFIRNNGAATAQGAIIVEFATPDGFSVSTSTTKHIPKWLAEQNANLPPKIKGTNVLHGDTELIGHLDVRPKDILAGNTNTRVAYTIRCENGGTFTGELEFIIKLVEGSHKIGSNYVAGGRRIIHPGFRV